MQIHELKPKHSSHVVKRVGRGGKKGTYSGRGGKGQSARAGRKMVPIIRELIKRYPKLKGYRSFVFAEDVAVVSLNSLEKHFETGEVITPELLMKKGIVHAINTKTPKIKILGNGAVTKKFTIEHCNISKTAKEAIEKAGGTIK